MCFVYIHPFPNSSMIHSLYVSTQLCVPFKPFKTFASQIFLGLGLPLENAQYIRATLLEKPLFVSQELTMTSTSTSGVNLLWLVQVLFMLSHLSSYMQLPCCVWMFHYSHWSPLDYTLFLPPFSYAMLCLVTDNDTSHSNFYN